MSTDLSFFESNVPVVITLYKVFVAIGWGLLIGNCAFQCLKAMFAGLGFETESPAILLVRTAIFGTLLIFSMDICDIALSIAKNIINLIGMPTSLQLTLPDNSHFMGNSAWVLVILIGVILGFQLIKLFFEIAERYVVVCILTLLCPVGLAMGGSKSTKDICTGFMRVYISMITMMVLNVLFLKLIISALATVPESYLIVPWSLLIVGIARTARKADQLIAKIGLNPAFTGDPLGNGRGTMIALMAARTIISRSGRTGSSSGNVKSGRYNSSNITSNNMENRNHSNNTGGNTNFGVNNSGKNTANNSNNSNSRNTQNNREGNNISRNSNNASVNNRASNYSGNAASSNTASNRFGSSGFTNNHTSVGGGNVINTVGGSNLNNRFGVNTGINNSAVGGNINNRFGAANSRFGSVSKNAVKNNTNNKFGSAANKQVNTNRFEDKAKPKMANPGNASNPEVKRNNGKQSLTTISKGNGVKSNPQSKIRNGSVSNSVKTQVPKASPNNKPNTSNTFKRFGSDSFGVGIKHNKNFIIKPSNNQSVVPNIITDSVREKLKNNADTNFKDGEIDG